MEAVITTTKENTVLADIVSVGEHIDSFEADKLIIVYKNDDYLLNDPHEIILRSKAQHYNDIIVLFLPADYTNRICFLSNKRRKNLLENLNMQELCADYAISNCMVDSKIISSLIGDIHML